MKWSLILAASIAIISAFARRCQADKGELYITAEGHLMASYDMLQFEMTLEADVKNTSNGNAASLAQTRASESSKALLKALEETGIPLKNITTSSINLAPINKYEDGVSNLIGYQASVNLLVQVAVEASSLPSIYESIAGFQEEGISVNVFAFKPFLSDEAMDAYEEELFNITMQNGMKKAEMYAQGVNRELGDVKLMSDRPIGIDSNNGLPPPQPVPYMGMTNRAATPEAVPDPGDAIPLGRGEKLEKQIYLVIALD